MFIQGAIWYGLMQMPLSGKIFSLLFIVSVLVPLFYLKYREREIQRARLVERLMWYERFRLEATRHREVLDHAQNPGGHGETCFAPLENILREAGVGLD